MLDAPVRRALGPSLDAAAATLAFVPTVAGLFGAYW